MTSFLVSDWDWWLWLGGYVMTLAPVTAPAYLLLSESGLVVQAWWIWISGSDLTGDQVLAGFMVCSFMSWL